jgi:hypothetical protein
MNSNIGAVLHNAVAEGAVPNVDAIAADAGGVDCPCAIPGERRAR